MSPVSIFNLSNKLKSWKDSRNPAGYCKDGYSYGIPLYCPPGKRDEASDGRCDEINGDVRIVSIDGSSYLQETLSGMIASADLTPKWDITRRMWRYLNFAMSDQRGTVRFTKQSRDRNAGFEGGSIRASGAEDDSTTEAVNMTSVDLFMSDNGMTRLDLLKIDTEGNDNKVIGQCHIGQLTESYYSSSLFFY